jgi:hypothetical protein
VAVRDDPETPGSGLQLSSPQGHSHGGIKMRLLDQSSQTVITPNTARMPYPASLSLKPTRVLRRATHPPDL